MAFILAIVIYFGITAIPFLFAAIVKRASRGESTAGPSVTLSIILILIWSFALMAVFH